MSDIAITLHDPSTGRSESMPVPNSLTIQEVLDLGKALLGLEDDGDSGKLVVAKYGKALVPPTQTLAEAGVGSGDLLAFLRMRPSGGGQAAVAASSPGLDFSNLLGAGSTGSAPASGGGGGGLNFSSLLGQSQTPESVYYPGMSFEQALQSNPHPRTIVELLQKHSHLFKEFNYHMPLLAQQIQQAPSFEIAVEIWRKDMVTNSIRSAAATSQTFHKERAFRQRLQQNSNDTEAKEYFSKKDAQVLVNEQYMQAMQEYPESMGKVLMLYINAKINSHPLQAFVDSGAQMTIMSKSCAQRCGILHLLDTRFHGVAVGVGTGTILGRIHIVQLQIGDYHFPCSVTIMDDATLPQSGGNSNNDQSTKNAAKPKDMDLLLGLDMLKRFNCSIDLMEGKLLFRLGGTILETPFLHEKDLDASKGGTKGFDATRSNRELEDAQRKYKEQSENKQQQNQTNQDGDGKGVDVDDDDMMND